MTSKCGINLYLTCTLGLMGARGAGVFCAGREGTGEDQSGGGEYRRNTTLLSRKSEKANERTNEHERKRERERGGKREDEVRFRAFPSPPNRISLVWHGGDGGGGGGGGGALFVSRFSSLTHSLTHSIVAVSCHSFCSAVPRPRIFSPIRFPIT